MKTFEKLYFSAFFLFMLPLSSCDILVPDDSPGVVSFHFSNDSYLNTKSVASIPDTNSFFLSVIDSKGKEIYNGPYGASPESFELAPDSYTVTAVSTEFKAPKFSSPQYGDKQVVVVAPGTQCSVELVCRQLNSGVKLNISSNFLSSFPNGSLFLKNPDGKLLYSYSEKRIAYFNPGQISLMLSNGSTDETLLTRTLESQEILVLNISAPESISSSKSGISIQIDTNRYWSTENYVIGEDDSKGAEKDCAYSVGQARNYAGASDVWVCGYIVGGDLTSSSVSFSPPFKSRTSVAIASRASVSSKESCMSVQLQKGNIRDALNLVDNPDNIGKEVYLKGDIVESYYGIPGLQNITEYEFK